VGGIKIQLAEIDRALERLEKLFPSGQYELTLIARYIGDRALDADVLLTRDDFGKLRELMEHYATKDPRFRVGDRITCPE
jgi:hypothetical protein